jgi:hypothetical protein
MTMPDTEEGQMRSRQDREWRDATNPFGPPSGVEPDEPRADSRRPTQMPELGDGVETDSTAGPGGGGATEWPGRVKSYEGLHGGPSRRP